MSEERDFDDIMREKLSAPESFPFSEDKWARMEELIIAADAKKKRRRFFLIFFSGFITACLIFFLFFYLMNERVKNTLNSNSGIHHTEGQNSGSESASKTVHSGTSKLTQENKHPKHENEMKETKPSEHQTNQHIEDQKQLAKLEDRSDEKQTTQILIRKGSSKKQNIKPFSVANHGNMTHEQKQGNEHKGGDVRNKSDQNKQTQDNNSNQSNDAAKGSQNDQSTLENNEIAKQQNREKEIADSIQQAENKRKENNLKKDSTGRAAEQALIASNMDTLKSGLQPLETVKPFGIALFGGASYNLGWNANDGKSLSPTFGVSVMYRLPSSWIISSGLYYSSVSKLSFQKEITQRTYDFGYRDQVYNLDQKNIQYLCVPLEIGKKVRNSTFTLGFSAAYLFQAKGDLQNFQRNSLNPNSGTTTSQSGNYFDGFKRIDFQPSFAFEQQVYKNLSAQVQFVYGLSDVRDNNWTNNTFFERNKAIRVVLKYKLR